MDVGEPRRTWIVEPTEPVPGLRPGAPEDPAAPAPAPTPEQAPAP